MHTDEAISFIETLPQFEKISFNLNDRRIKREKLLKKLRNNFKKNQRFAVAEKQQVLPFYKGDFNYYRDNYGVKGWSRLKKCRIYINALSDLG